MNATKRLNNLNDFGYEVNVMDNQSILVVQDPAASEQGLVVNRLKQSGYRVNTAYGFQEGLKLSTSSQAKIVILDWEEATDVSLAFIIAFKQHPLTRNVPLIFVTTTSHDQVVTEYLQAGADDYVIKPCLDYVLGILVRFALLKIEKFLPQKLAISLSELSNIPKLKFDSSQKMIFLDFNGKIESIELCPIGFKLLYLLAQNPDKPVSRLTIKNHLCGTLDAIDDRTVDVYIRRLRLTLSKNNIEEIIRTVRGVGYSFNSSLVNYLLA